MCGVFDETLPYDCNIDFAISAVMENYALHSVFPVALNFHSVRENLAHSKEQWLDYMKRYMPRSAAEAAYLCHKYLSNCAVRKIFVSSKKTIRILSVMCGNGGDTFGVLSAFIDMLSAADLSSYPDIEITAVDGNTYALEQLDNLFSAWNEAMQAGVLKGKKCHITLKTVNFIFDPATDSNIKTSFNNLYDLINGEDYDIVTCFKGIGEVIQSHIRTALPNLRNKNFFYGFNNNAYACFLNLFAAVLSDRGAVIIADSSNILDGNDSVMTNRLLAHQVFNYLKYDRSGHDMHLVYPRPCACMAEGKGSERNCSLNRDIRDDSYRACLIQESATAVSRYNRTGSECFAAMILCHGKAYSAIKEELTEKDCRDICFKLVGQTKGGSRYICGAF